LALVENQLLLALLAYVVELFVPYHSRMGRESIYCPWTSRMVFNSWSSSVTSKEMIVRELKGTMTRLTEAEIPKPAKNA
jgi:hypothetical protein